MDQAIKQKWVEALLSGEYEQSFSGFLKHADSYCCLGVLRETMGTEWDSTCMLLRSELNKAGLTHEQQKALARTNDAGVPFDMIAGLIDEAL